MAEVSPHPGTAQLIPSSPPDKMLSAIGGWHFLFCRLASKIELPTEDENLIKGDQIKIVATMTVEKCVCVPIRVRITLFQKDQNGLISASLLALYGSNQ